MRSIAESWLTRAEDPNPGLRFEDDEWSWSQVVKEAERRATWWIGARRPDPPHVAVLLDNVPEQVWWLGACALSGSVFVGANSTHRGAALAQELAYTRCQLLVTDMAHLALVEGLDLGRGIGVVSADNNRVFLVDAGRRQLPLAGAGPHDDIEPGTLGYLIFTSGHRVHPKPAAVPRDEWPPLAPCLRSAMASVPTTVAIWPCPSFIPMR